MELHHPARLIPELILARTLSYWVNYTEDMIFIMPGQTDLIEGIPGIRAAVENLNAAVPAGFEITGLRHIEGENEVLTICSSGEKGTDISICASGRRSQRGPVRCLAPLG